MIRGRSYFKLATKQALGPTGKNGGQAHKRKAKLFPRRPAGIRGNNHDRGLAWQKRPSQKQDHAANTASRGGDDPCPRCRRRNLAKLVSSVSSCCTPWPRPRRFRMGGLGELRGNADRSELFERLTGCLQNHVLSGVLLPTTYGDIDKARLDLDAEC